MALEDLTSPEGQTHQVTLATKGKMEMVGASMATVLTRGCTLAVCLIRPSPMSWEPYFSSRKSREGK